MRSVACETGSEISPPGGEDRADDGERALAPVAAQRDHAARALVELGETAAE